MITEPIFERILILATLLCTLNAGFLFAFAAIVMPGIKQLDDYSFIKAFQQIDRVIQKGHPLFIVVWAGSALTLVFATVLTVVIDVGPQSALITSLLVAACVSYLLGVQLLTFLVHLPLNNKMQQINAELSDGLELAKHRMAFEPRWNRWNVLRTVIGSGVSVLLLISLTLN